MRRVKSGWRARRIKHRDAIILCVLSAAFLLAGELANPVLLTIYQEYLVPVLDSPALFALYAILAVLAFTTAFGAVLVLLGGWYFSRGRVPRGRFFVGLGLGLTFLSLMSRIAYHTLVTGSPVPFLLFLTWTPAGLGILFGVAAHTLMGQYALLLKKRAARAWRRWRRHHRPTQALRSRARRIKS